MTQNYITLSLETHLFFSRIMKEHALFREANHYIRILQCARAKEEC